MMYALAGSSTLTTAVPRLPPLRQSFEQAALGAPVVVHVGVEVEVVVAEVGEHGDVEVDLGDAPQLERVRGHLHHRRRAAAVDRGAQQRLQQRRLGRRLRRRHDAVAEPVLDGAEARHALPGRRQHRFDEIRGRRLAAGAGDADDAAARATDDRRSAPRRSATAAQASRHARDGDAVDRADVALDQQRARRRARSAAGMKSCRSARVSPPSLR